MGIINNPLRTIIILPLIVFLFVSCNKINKEQIVNFNLNEYVQNDTTIYLNDIANNIEYIKLETFDSSYIGVIKQLDIIDKHLFVLDNHLKISHFNNIGKFINSIGRIGKGPGEFIEPISFALFQNKNIIAVYDVAQLKIILFSYTGSFISEFRVSSFPLKIANLGDSLIVAAVPFPEFVSNNNFGISIFNLKGDLVKKVINREIELKTRDFDRNTAIEGRIYLQKSDSSIKYWEMYLDTVFNISIDGTVTKEYSISNSKHSKSVSSNRIVENVLWYGKILDTKSYLFVSPCVINNKIKHLIINKKSNKGYNFMVHEDLGKSQQIHSGIINNIDGGWPINPIKKTSDGRIYASFFGHELKNLMNSDFFKKQDINNPSKREELDSLLSESCIFDNPIIMLVSLN